MKPHGTGAAVLAVAMMSISGGSYAQKSPQKTDFGQREYDNQCAVCHGKLGKGDGPYAGIVDTRIADLTTLTKRNGGVFPLQRVYETIDGRKSIRGHSLSGCCRRSLL
jgi:hypothetical protein